MLLDQFGRDHNYLRISLTERCNLRCFYCMPAEGIALSPKEHIMTAEEIFELAKTFVGLGVTKIRLTGGEPLVRKDFRTIVENLNSLNVDLAVTTNGILINEYLDLFTSKKINKINISLDTLDEAKFASITRRDYFTRVRKNIDLLISNNIFPKINVVLIKGTNDSEILDFVEFTRNTPVTVQFIEYMPFNGNKWDNSKCVSYKDIMNIVKQHYLNDVIKVEDEKNDTSKKYKIKNYKGSFGVISTVSNPFCDNCNRLRLTADGKLKNCLFSSSETNLLAELRKGGDVTALIKWSVLQKAKQRSGIDNFELRKDLYEKNRSMILIGG